MSVERAVHVVRCRGMDILRQLRMEEALLRCDHRNWCIVNDGAPPAAPPAIVMGISGYGPSYDCRRRLRRTTADRSHLNPSVIIPTCVVVAGRVAMVTQRS
jgi:hypothetical protein